ncbi:STRICTOSIDINE SYNTHASE-LIKE 13-like protein [Drosera capensis]
MLIMGFMLLGLKVGWLQLLTAHDADGMGPIFFTVTSTRYNRVQVYMTSFSCRNHFLIMLEGESTGRLLGYDPSTKQTHVVLNGLAFPNGVQLSKNHSFLIFTDTTNCRWLEVGDIRAHGQLCQDFRITGDFWVAIDCRRTAPQEVLSHNPWLRSMYFRLPFPMKWLVKWTGMRMYTVVSLLNENDEILQVLEDRKGAVMKLMSEILNERPIQEKSAEKQAKTIGAPFVIPSNGPAFPLIEKSTQNASPLYSLLYPSTTPLTRRRPLKRRRPLRRHQRKMEADRVEVGPTEDTVRALIDLLVDPLLPAKVSVAENPPASQEEAVAEQMHSVVLLYNYYHRKWDPQLEFLEFDSFC